MDAGQKNRSQYWLRLISGGALAAARPSIIGAKGCDARASELSRWQMPLSDTNQKEDAGDRDSGSGLY